jgi:DNA repair protein RecN (Recombination protein N)
LGAGERVRSELVQLSPAERVEELARMLGGATVTAKTRAHAREMLGSASRNQQSGTGKERRIPGA